MILICTVSIILDHFMFQQPLEGKVISANEINYYVDFSAALKKTGFTLANGADSKLMVRKEDCVKKP